MAQTPLLGQFLVAINGFTQARNEAQLTDYLVLEPPFSPHYHNMIKELREAYPKGREDALEQRCEQSLPSAVEGEEGSSWSALVRFMSCYLNYLRDVDADETKLLKTYDLLSELQEKANNALKHGLLGYLILPTTIRVAKLVCRLAIGLDKRPELIAHLRGSNPSTSGGDESGERETLPERAAKIVQGAFNTCVSDRNATTNTAKDGKLGGKKAGIVVLANLCLRILFQCRKTRNANYLFSQVGESAPPLSAYPKSQRVTYLYYLGRYYFHNNHFFRAQAALQQAYNEAPAQDGAVSQRRLVLIYLVASNIILGRFPSQALLSQTEALEFSDHFLPLCIAIRKGDLSLFRRHFDPATSTHVDWLLKYRIYLQLRNRCEVLVWRSLIRKTFMIAGRQPDPTSRVAPTVDIDDLVTVFKALLQYHGTTDNPVDPDLEGTDVEINEILLPDEYTLESVLSSLIDQGLLGGYISHRQLKFAITGVKQKGVMGAGFPQPWAVLKASSDDGFVPGWKKDGAFGAGAATQGGGRVIHLSGARPAGS